MNKNNEPENQSYYMPLCMGAGLALGTAIGAATKNLSICMSMGMLLGMCIGSVLDVKHRKENSDSSQPDDKDETV